MARMTVTPELKKAVLALSSSEKDKLLLRLLPSKPDLVKQLEFRLLEGGETTEARREELKAEIEESITSNLYYSPVYLLLDLRSYSGSITQHVKITKDRLGEIELNFVMLNETFERFGGKLSKLKLEKVDKLFVYVIQRTLKLLKLLSKLHEDYHLEFRDSMRALGQHFTNLELLMMRAKTYGLNVKWLLEGQVPEEWEL